MRVAVIVKNLTMGGMQRAAVNLSETFAAQGHETHLIYFKAKHKALQPSENVHLHLLDLEKALKRTGIGALLYPFAKLLNGLVRHSYFVWQGLLLAPVFKHLFKKLQREQGAFDLIIIRGQGTFEMIWPFNDRRLVLQQVNVIRHRNGLLHDFFLRRLFDKKQVMCNAPSVYDELLGEFRQSGIHPKSLTVIPSPINVRAIQEKAQAYEPDYPHPYIINVGRFSHAKNLSLLIDAFAYAKQKLGMRQHLVLVGDGELKKEYLAQIKAYGLEAYVHFTGVLKNPYPWMKKADLFVFTSFFEGLPNVLLESLCCHTGIVSTRGRGGTLNIMSGDLEQNLTAFDKVELAEKMTEVLASKQAIDFENHLEAYSPSQVVHSYIAAYGTPSGN